jgi:hypothetical protein
MEISFWSGPQGDGDKRGQSTKTFGGNSHSSFQDTLLGGKLLGVPDIALVGLAYTCIPKVEIPGPRHVRRALQ